MSQTETVPSESTHSGFETRGPLEGYIGTDLAGYHHQYDRDENVVTRFAGLYIERVTPLGSRTIEEYIRWVRAQLGWERCTTESLLRESLRDDWLDARDVPQTYWLNITGRIAEWTHKETGLTVTIERRVRPANGRITGREKTDDGFSVRVAAADTISWDEELVEFGNHLGAVQAAVEWLREHPHGELD